MGHFSSKNRYLHFTSTFDQLQTLKFRKWTTQLAAQCLSIPFVHLMNTCTVLLLLTKAKVQKIPCDQLSVNMAARQMFGTRDLV